jgi:hypothetical protein
LFYVLQTGVVARTEIKEWENINRGIKREEFLYFIKRDSLAMPTDGNTLFLAFLVLKCVTPISMNGVVSGGLLLA